MLFLFLRGNITYCFSKNGGNFSKNKKGCVWIERKIRKREGLKISDGRRKR